MNGGNEPITGNQKLEWYRDSTRWLVIISGAAIVLGLNWVNRGNFGFVEKSLFSLAGAILLFSSAAGIFSIFKFADYEGSIAEQKVDRAKQDRSAANTFFRICFWLFFSGLIVLVGTGYWLIWGERLSKAGSGRFEVSYFGKGSDVVGALMDRDMKKMYLIKEGKNSKLIIVSQ